MLLRLKISYTLDSLEPNLLPLLVLFFFHKKEIDLFSGCCTKLDNSGIEGKAITLMAELDHTVYATTCTGLYFTETERLKPKSNDAEQ